MFRAARADAFSAAVPHVLVALLTLSLLVTAGVASTPSAAAGTPSADAAGLRARQLRAEATMLRADKQIRRLENQRRNHAKLLRSAKRKLDRAIDRRDRVRGRHIETSAKRDRVERVFDRALRVRPNPRGTQATDKPALRKQLRKLDRKVARLKREVRAEERKVKRARELKQSRWKKVGRDRIAARRAARERAEDKLGSSIIAMLELAQARADRRFRVSSRTSFRKPASGSISQRYGCTGYRTNPRRGSCAHFHDGIDIAAPRGTRVRASADGYVAYVGRNPWDQGKRAFVVIIGHADDYQTVYAHLKPRRLIRAGQRVERGDVIGLIGVTGRTTGPHVHWEVRRGGQSLDPMRAAR